MGVLPRSDPVMWSSLYQQDRNELNSHDDDEDYRRRRERDPEGYANLRRAAVDAFTVRDEIDRREAAHRLILGHLSSSSTGLHWPSGKSQQIVGKARATPIPRAGRLRHRRLGGTPLRYLRGPTVCRGGPSR